MNDSRAALWLATVLMLAAAPARATEPATAEAAATEPAAVRAQPQAAAAPAAAAAATGVKPAATDVASDGSTDGEPSARKTVDSLHEQLLAVMKEATTLGYQGRYDRLAPALEKAYDLDFMANKAAGRHWHQLDADGQRRWTEAFKRFTIATYASRFDGYSGQSFETLGDEPASHDTVLVMTRVNDPEGENVELNYRLRKTEAGWKIIDVYLNGSVSELALRRAEYSTAFDRNGLDEVIVSLENKIDDLSASTEN